MTEPIVFKLGTLNAARWPSYIRVEVPSSNKEADPYVVYVLPNSDPQPPSAFYIMCDCPGYKFRGKCRHATSVADELKSYLETVKVEIP